MSKFQSFWNLAPDATRPGILNMYVYGRITSSSHWLFGSDTDVVTSRFVKDLRNYPDVKRINVYINSPGGDVFAAAAIKNQLKAHPAEVHSYIDGLGASAAVGLAMGADVVHMSRSALIMVHNPSTQVQGEAKDLEKGVEVLQKVKTTIVAIYQEKTGLPEEKLANLMDEESWLTADEALSLGFIDKINEDGDLEIVNGEDNIIVNGVKFDFTNDITFKVGGFAFCNNISREKLEDKLLSIKSKQGGMNVMNLEALLNSMSDEQRAEFDKYVASKVTEATNTLQTQWNEEKEDLQGQIKNLEAATAPPASDPTENPEDAIFNSLPEEAKAIVLKAKQEAAAAEAKLADAEKVKAFEDFKSKMAVYDALPMQNEHIEALHQLAVADEAKFKQVEDLLKVANAAMANGFKPTGSDEGQSANGSALDELNNKIDALRTEHPTLSYNDAMKQIVASEPALYQRYRAEM
jgi:ATP-dependent Clp protease protease subunit